MIYCTKGWGKKRREIIEDCFIPEQPEAGKAVKRRRVGECDGSTTSHELVAEEAREQSHHTGRRCQGKGRTARGSQVEIQVNLLATTLAYPYLLNL